MAGNSLQWVDEVEGFDAEIGGPITEQTARRLLGQYPQPWRTKAIPFRFLLGWDNWYNDSKARTSGYSHSLSCHGHLSQL